MVNERRRQETIAVTTDYDQEQTVVKEILDEIVEKICYGTNDNHSLAINDWRFYLDEATEQQVNSTLSTNDIIEDAQSTQGDMNDRGMLLI